MSLCVHPFGNLIEHATTGLLDLGEHDLSKFNLRGQLEIIFEAILRNGTGSLYQMRHPLLVERIEAFKPCFLIRGEG
ncbi:MAG: hypothetical protein BGP07_08220 [Rhizobiales bacterium 63-22]|nr:MAG: hypothetical protein BGP07_08220 [Rhizobiales bacterium 63-22]